MESHVIKTRLRVFCAPGNGISNQSAGHLLIAPVGNLPDRCPLSPRAALSNLFLLMAHKLNCSGSVARQNDIFFSYLTKKIIGVILIHSHRQLLLCHFLFDSRREERSCSAWVVRNCMFLRTFLWHVGWKIAVPKESNLGSNKPRFSFCEYNFLAPGSFCL